MPYMSPELLCGELATECSDIFSAGAVLYEMATGRLAFPQTRMALLVDAILHQDPVPPSTSSLHIPATFDRLVNKAMQKRPAKQRRWARVNPRLSAIRTALSIGVSCREAQALPFSDRQGRSARS